MVFAGALEIDNIIMLLSALLGNAALFVPGQTVIILEDGTQYDNLLNIRSLIRIGYCFLWSDVFQI